MITKEFQETYRSIEKIDSLFQENSRRYDSANVKIDLGVESISFYKETNLSTGTSSYFTKVVVTRNGEIKGPVDLRLGIDDGTAIDTSWVDTSGAFMARHVFEFQTDSSPEYVQLDPWGKIGDDINYSNNSLTVDDNVLSVVKWINRLFNFFQNALLSSGAIV